MNYLRVLRFLTTSRDSAPWTRLTIIPLFLSFKTVRTTIDFSAGSPAEIAASTVGGLSTSSVPSLYAVLRETLSCRRNTCGGVASILVPPCTLGVEYPGWGWKTVMETTGNFGRAVNHTETDSTSDDLQ